MFKNSKGVTLIALILTIIVIIMITSIVVISSDSILANARVQQRASIMLTIKTKINMLIDRMEFEGDNSILPEGVVFIDSLSSEELESTGIDILMDEGIVDASGVWMSFHRLENFEFLGINEELPQNVQSSKIFKQASSNKETYYAFNVVTRELVWIPGVRGPEGVVYKMSDMIGDQE